jgi:hypothetical protein
MDFRLQIPATLLEQKGNNNEVPGSEHTAPAWLARQSITKNAETNPMGENAMKTMFEDEQKFIQPTRCGTLVLTCGKAPKRSEWEKIKLEQRNNVRYNHTRFSSFGNVSRETHPAWMEWIMGSSTFMNIRSFGVRPNFSVIPLLFPVPSLVFWQKSSILPRFPQVFWISTAPIYRDLQEPGGLGKCCDSSPYAAPANGYLIETAVQGAHAPTV